MALRSNLALWCYTPTGAAVPVVLQDYGALIEGLEFTTVAPGGFGDLACIVKLPDARLPRPELGLFSRAVLKDGLFTCFSGEWADPALVLDAAHGEYVLLSALGGGVALRDDPDDSNYTTQTADQIMAAEFSKRSNYLAIDSDLAAFLPTNPASTFSPAYDGYNLEEILHDLMANLGDYTWEVWDHPTKVDAVGMPVWRLEAHARDTTTTHYTAYMQDILSWRVTPSAQRAYNVVQVTYTDVTNGTAQITVSDSRLAGTGAQNNAPFRRRKLRRNLGRMPLTAAQATAIANAWLQSYQNISNKVEVELANVRDAYGTVIPLHQVRADRNLFVPELAVRGQQLSGGPVAAVNQFYIVESSYRETASGDVRLAQQYEFVFSPSRFAFYVGGVGAGKTWAGALRAVIRSQEHFGSLGLIGAPTYPMLRDVTQRTFFELLPASLIRSFSKTDNHLILKNGSEILFRSTDTPDRLRGLNLAWFWLDEAPLCGYYAWQVLKARLRQSGQETAGWATGTPVGRDGYARDFELARQDNHALYRASTWANAHNLPEGFVADLGYTGAFAEQEIEGLFVAFEGLVYLLDATEQGNLKAWPHQLTQLGRVIGGIDWGYTNPAALIPIGLDGDKRAWVLDEFYQRRASQEEVILPALVKFTKQYNVAVWYADAADPEAIDRANNALAREGLQCRVRAAQKGAGSVRAGIQTVTSLLATRGDGTRGLYVDPARCVNLIAEFGSYAYATAERSKRDPAEEPVKQSDHLMDALRYALHSALGQQTATEAYLASMASMVKPVKNEDVLI